MHTSLQREFSMKLKLSTFALVLLSVSSANAEDQAGTRDVRLKDASARHLQINQIETSKFPRVDIFATILEGEQPITGLSASDFRVREDEVEQEPIHVEPRLLP